MPFRNYEDFDPEILRTMTAAYDAVASKLKLVDTDPRTSKLAIAIVGMVRAGELDPVKLQDGALAALAKEQ